MQEFYHDIRVPFPDLDPDRGTYVFGSQVGDEIVTYALKEYFTNVFEGIWTVLVRDALDVLAPFYSFCHIAVPR